MEQSAFELLANAGSSVDTLILIGAPTIVGAVLISILGIFIYRKRKKDQVELEKEYEISDRQPNETSTESLKSETKLAESSWNERVREGLFKTRSSLSGAFKSLFSGRRALDQETLDRIHEVLYKADLGVATTDHIIDQLRTRLGNQSDVSWEDIKLNLRQVIEEILGQTESSLTTPTKPHVILIVGVNGVGKTTSIAKITSHFLKSGKKVLLGAADTFRAAAIDQLCEWANRLGVDVVKHQSGADPAAVAFDAVKAAKARDVDVLIIDTAGRLHSKTELMAELQKIHRIIGKELPGAPHEVLLVIDATTGQNATLQVKAFKEIANLTGLVVTKLDGTAKGGVVVGIAHQHKVPIRYIGVGEKADDLRPFEAKAFADSLLD